MSAQPFVEIDLEAQIEFQRRLMCNAKTPEEARSSWNRFKELVQMRTPERVYSMECERGLR